MKIPRKRLKESRDSRFLPSVQARHEDALAIVKSLKSGNTSVSGSAEDNNWKVLVLSNGRIVYISKADLDHPVPVGKFMGWWEPDHETYFGVSKEEWEDLSYEERADVEAKLQLKLWVEKEYFLDHAFVYSPEEYDRWWWDEGGKELDLEAQNAYWKKRLKETASLDVVDAAINSLLQ